MPVGWRFWPIRHYLFSVWTDGPVSRSTSRHGLFDRSHDPVHYWYRRYADYLDLPVIPDTPVADIFVSVLSGILGCHCCDAGDLFLVCEEEDT